MFAKNCETARQNVIVKYTLSNLSMILNSNAQFYCSTLINTSSPQSIWYVQLFNFGLHDFLEILDKYNIRNSLDTDLTHDIVVICI